MFINLADAQAKFLTAKSTLIEIALVMEEIVNTKHPILVTGSPRSGTTWIGEVLSKYKNIGYIHEPFNINTKAGICNAHFQYWFSFVTKENDSNYYHHLKSTLAFRYNLIIALKSVHNTKEFRRVLREWKVTQKYRLGHARPLIKDPLAVFSAQWLASRYNAQVVIMVRHPCAVVASFRRLNWKVKLADFLSQPLLIKNHLEPYQEKIKQMLVEDADIIDQASLLWKMIYHVVLDYQRQYPDWIFIRHEDIATDPHHWFRILQNKLHLEIGQNLSDVIDKYSYSQTQGLPTNQWKFLECESKETIRRWQSELSPQEIAQIKSNVADIATNFYSEQEWL